MDTGSPEERPKDDGTPSVAGGGAVVLLGQLIGKALRLVFRLGASWILTTSTYGIFVLAMSVAELAGRVGTLGFDRAALRFGAEARGRFDEAELRGGARFSLVVAACSGVLAGALVYLLADPIAGIFDKEDLAEALRLVAAAIPAVAVSMTAAAGLQSAQRMRSYVLVSFVIPSAVGVAGLCLALATDTEEVGACAAFSAGWILAALYGARAVISGGTGSQSRRPEMVRFALLMLSYVGAAQLVSQVDRFMVGGLRSAEEVAYYDAAAVIAYNLPIFLTALNAVVFPKVGAAHHAGKPEEVRALYQLETRWVTLLTIPLLLLVVTLGEPLLSLWGQEFTVATTTVVVLAVAQTLNASAGPVGGVLMMTGHEKLVLANTLLLGGLNAVGNYLLVPEYGIIGAAISTACAVVCWNVASLVEVYVFLGIQPYNTPYMKVAATGALALGAALGILFVLPPWGGWVAFPAALAVYAAGYQWFAQQPEDRQLADIIRRKIRS